MVENIIHDIMTIMTRVQNYMHSHVFFLNSYNLLDKLQVCIIVIRFETQSFILHTFANFIIF